MRTTDTLTVKPVHTRGVIYAMGGGRGHLQRARLIAHRFTESVIIHPIVPAYAKENIVSPPVVNASQWIRSFIEQQIQQGAWLVVDTFPLGIHRELSVELIRKAQQSILVARYLRTEAYPRYLDAAMAYDHRWLPYEKKFCEWGGRLLGEYIGVLTRSIEVDTSDRCSLLVIGEQWRLPSRWRRAFPEDTRSIDRYFRVLPDADRVIGVGAGYNLVWELVQLRMKAAHFPLYKRYDDQFLRAGRIGRSVTDLSSLRQFLGSKIRPNVEGAGKGI